MNVNSVQVEHGCSSLQGLWMMHSRWRSQLAMDLLQDVSPHLLFLLDLGSLELLETFLGGDLGAMMGEEKMEYSLDIFFFYFLFGPRSLYRKDTMKNKFFRVCPI